MSASNGKARAVEIIEDDPEHQSSSGSEGSEDELGDPALPEASTPSTSSKKKKKKRGKVLKALSALRGGRDHIPGDLVNVVLEKVKETGQAPDADEATVRMALEQMKIKDVIQGKAGIGGKNKKDTGGHKVRWCAFLRIARSSSRPCHSSGPHSLSLSSVGTSDAPYPVHHLEYLSGEDAPTADGYIEPSKPASEVRQEPYPLPKDFEWSVVDITDDAQVRFGPCSVHLDSCHLCSCVSFTSCSARTTSRTTTRRSASSIRRSSCAGVCDVPSPFHAG